jgi:EAL domain-containing protein (putative c-di-GMP-specific phosphodiesterase class I)
VCHMATMPQSVGPAPAKVGPDRRLIQRACTDPNYLRAVFQPIVDLTTGAICGFEALARFPVHRPDQWFRAAAELDLGGFLEATIFRTAMDAVPQLPEGTFLSVNLSPAAARTEELALAFAAYDSYESVMIELTDPVSVPDCDALIGALAPIRERGARVAVDETGRDATPLLALATMEPDFVKIDRSLIVGIDSMSARKTVVTAATAVAEKVGARVIAQGIENEGELEAVIGLGVDMGQGFAFGHALPRLMVHSHRHERKIAELAAQRVG